MPLLKGNLVEEIKMLPRCRAMQNGIVYHGRIVPEEAILMLGFIPSSRMMPYPARTLFFLLSEQSVCSEAWDTLNEAIQAVIGHPADVKADTEFIVSVVPVSDLLW